MPPDMPSSILSPKTPHQQPGMRASSPSYFGLATDSNAASFHPHHLPTRTPTSNSVHPAAAVSPQSVTLSSSRDYDDFKKQLELNRFNRSKQAPLSRSSSSGSSNGPPSQDWHSPFSVRHSSGKKPPGIPHAATVGEDDLISAPRSPPKRGLSELNDGHTRARRHSPADFNDADLARSLGSPPSRAHDKPTRGVSMEVDSSVSNPLVPGLLQTQSVPETTAQPAFMLSPEAVAELLSRPSPTVLLLDMRVSTQYARSRIAGALNLCIPTTLLKRPSYNVQRLADTFKEDEQRADFSTWRSRSTIVVYDNASSQMREAHSCLNIIKKFVSEGWEGEKVIVKGGFTAFAKSRPDMVDNHQLGGQAAAAEPASHADALDLPPVMGGCPLPESKSAVNPFFGNIRQNLDLIGGVGRIPVKCPVLLSESARCGLPYWLRDASDSANKGKPVADKFLRIEQREKSRMEEALSGDVTYGKAPGPQTREKISIAGIEKGSKNRYHNIMPFEHSRVKLKGVPRGGCDYVNANFLETSLSPRKKYIATQSPIPATFADFWTMVWQRDVRVIVMLTAETEGNQIKAHNYWRTDSYGPIRLQLLSEHRATLEPQRVQRSKMRPLPPASSKDEAFVVVRKFTMSHDGLPFERMREVTQLHFAAWPDFGVPTQAGHLLGLVEQCDNVVRASSSGASPPGVERPVLVHCSAGCGRTGTFCTVDTVVDALKHQRRWKHGDGQGEAQEDLVARAVEEFRLQRLSMVQSLDQFVFCYEAVLEWIAGQTQPPLTA